MYAMDAPPVSSEPLPRCPRCGACYPTGSRFCAQDGTPLTDPGMAAGPVAEDLANAKTVVDSAVPGARLRSAASVSGVRALRRSPEALIASRYLKVRSLGEGGQGDVLLVQDIETGRMLALKRFHPDMDDARCRAEVLAAGRVEDHSHVVKVHELHRDPDTRQPFITMEYLDGETLQGRLDRGAELDLREALSVLRQVALGLCELHRLGLVHRDIKPANIMLCRSDAGLHVKLLDLGIAKWLAPGVKPLTVPGWIVGTLDYAAPEQLRGEPVTHACDIYSLGVVAARLFEGRLPHESTPAARAVPDGLRRLVDHLLAPEAADRPVSAAAVITALDRAERWLEATAKHSGPASPAGHASADHPVVRSDEGAAEAPLVVPRRLVLPRLLAATAAVAAAVLCLFVPVLEGAHEAMHAGHPRVEVPQVEVTPRAAPAQGDECGSNAGWAAQAC